MNKFKNIVIKLKNSSVVEKLVLINSVVFLLSFINKPFFIQWYSLSSDFNQLFIKIWTLFSYAFLHNDFSHLLSNLLILYYIGNLFNDFFNKKSLLPLYFLGLFSASLLFLIISYFTKSNTNLIGASGAVTSIFVALASRIPHYQIKLFLFGFVKLWVLAVIWVGFSLIQLSTNNYGGAIAHIGGAFMGFSFVYFHLDQIEWNNFINFSPKKKTKLKTIHKQTKKKNVVINDVNPEKQTKIDVILDKISKSGYDSLTQEERTFLFKQGK